MPSVVGPGVWGSIAQGASEGLFRGYDLARQAGLDEQARLIQEKINQLRDLQIGAGQHEAEQRALVQSVVPQIMAAPAAPVELAPAVAPRLAGPVIHGEDVEAQALIPRTPGQPSVTKPMLTMEDLAKQPGIGPQGLAAALASPQGQAALKARSVVTAEQVEQRRKKETALQEFRDRLGESMDKARAGDALGSILAERAAFMAAAEGSDDPARALERAHRATEDYRRLSQDTKETAATGRDLTRLVKAVDALSTKKDEQSLSSLMSVIGEMETKGGQTKAAELLLQVSQGKVAQIKNAPFVAINQKAAQILSTLPPGQKMDWHAALAQAIKADPASAAQALGQLQAEGKHAPDDWVMALSGTTATKNEWEAGQKAAQAKGLDPRSPAYWTEVASFVKSVKVEPRERTTENFIALRGQAISELQGLKRELKDPATEADRKDEIMGRVRYLEGDPKTKTEGMIGYYDRQINRAMGGGAPTEAAPAGRPTGRAAPEAPPTQPAPTVEARPPAFKGSADQLSGRRLETHKAAMTAELKRLKQLYVAAGDDEKAAEAKAVAEMKRKGW